MKDASCAGRTDLEWFPMYGRGPQNTPPLDAEIMKLCESCPVRGPCNEFARASPEEWGIWGGEYFYPYRAEYRDTVRRNDG